MVLATYRQVTQSLQRNFFRMARTGDNSQLVKRNTKAVVQIIGDNHILVRNHTLDGRDNHLMRHVATNLGQRLLHVWRRNGKNQDIRLSHCLIDVR